MKSNFELLYAQFYKKTDNFVNMLICEYYKINRKHI